MDFDYSSRMKKTGRKMSASRLDAVITGGLGGVGPNSFYFGEKSFPSIIVLLPDKSIVYTTEGENPNFDETVRYRDFRDHFSKLIKREKVRTVGVDERSDLAGITFFLQKKRLKPKPFGREIEELREIKDEKEIRLLKRAASQSADIIESVKPFGKTEHVVAGEMELAARKNGCSLDAFPPIVASGANSATPHSLTSSKRIERSDCVVVDAGVRVDGYCGDCTRTFYEGKDKQIKDAVEAVVEAKKAAERKVKPGISGSALARESLRVIEEYGFGEYSFRKAGLSLGHQIGLHVHEGRPFEKIRLAKGMAVTIEPGIYVPKRFGVRVEDVLTP